MVKKLYFLGTSAFIPTKTRDNTALLYRSQQKELILIDCPGSVVQKLMRLNIGHRTVKNIVISHTHPDHVYGLVSLIHSQHGCSKKINIYSSENAQVTIKAMIKIHNLDSSSFPKLNFIRLKHNEEIKVGPDLSIKAFDTKHSNDSLGIKIIDEATEIVYSSDTALFKEIGEYISEKTILIHECTSHSVYFEKHPKMAENHTSSKELAKLISMLKILPKVIYPVHFMIEKDDDLKKMQEELKAIPNVFWQEDMSCIEL